jgi:Uma2 family endonuclease
MAITLAPAPITEEPTSPPVERRNGVGYRSTKPSYQLRRDASDHGRYVSKEEYWANWYEAKPSYEWNNGYLEIKPMPNLIQMRLYHWYLALLHQYTQTYGNADLMFLETGFSMVVPDPEKPNTMKEVTRKPDIAAIRHDNKVRLQEHERSYRGICDLCIEALSDSDQGEIDRDIIIKKSEYEFAGVQEYYILDPADQHMHFYQRNVAGIYVEMQPDADGVIRSQVLPGFQFRRRDLKRLPSLEELALDPVYQGYVLLKYQAAAQAAAQERQRAEQERQRAEKERQRAERLAALLRDMGVDVDKV